MKAPHMNIHEKQQPLRIPQTFALFIQKHSNQICVLESLGLTLLGRNLACLFGMFTLYPQCEFLHL